MLQIKNEIVLALLEIKSKKHAKLQKFMQFEAKIVCLQALIFCYCIEDF